jgi:hypothetical protein
MSGNLSMSQSAATWLAKACASAALYTVCLAPLARASATDPVGATKQAPDAQHKRSQVRINLDREGLQRKHPDQPYLDHANKGQSQHGPLPSTGQLAPVTSGQSAPSDPGPKRATVTLKGGILMIEASNSDLGQILQDVAHLSGTSIHGPIHDARVYGVYGPQNPRDVLTDLLNGMGYNVMMVGLTAQGAPRDLLLTPKTGEASPVPNGGAPSAVPENNDSADTEMQEEDAPGPGAIVHPPPPPPENLQERVEQNIRRLQQMQDQQAPQDAPQ